MQKYINHSVGSDDGNSISFKREVKDFIGPAFTITFWHIGVIATLIIFTVFAYKYLNISGTLIEPFVIITNESSATIPQNTPSSGEPIFTDGFVFKDSNTRIITRKEILAYQNVKNPTFQRILRMAINEIYARKGQAFRTGEINDTYYQQYEWYTRTFKHTVEWNEFNEQEKANLRLLISIEQEYGYR